MTPVPVSGRVFDANDVATLVDCSLDFWLTTGRYAAEFERTFARYFGVRGASLVNSGSSANLVALSCLTSEKLGERALRPGDEVITRGGRISRPPSIRLSRTRLVPVFIDAELLRVPSEGRGPRSRAERQNARRDDRAYPRQSI